MNYYNEHDPKAAAWLTELVRAGLIPAGEVDDRDIQEVTGDDLRRFTQCHFFAGIGGWSYALQLAGWPSDVPVWTGSCPCQPLSSAGQRKGEMDERHLWPEFYRLVAECRPATVFGEQVASNDGLEWLDGVSLDLEELDYAIGSADLPAACVGSPHERQRVFWVADAKRWSSERQRFDVAGTASGDEGEARQRQRLRADAGPGGVVGILGHAEGFNGRLPIQHGRPQQEGIESEWSGPWSDFAILHFDDGKTRRAEPGSFPLAHGLPARMGRLRGYGNAIVPQVAAKFIRAYLEAAQ